MIRLAALIAALCALATQAWASELTLKANPVDDDGQVTLGEVFDGAGSASSIVVARRSGPSVVIEAGTLQAQARRAGLIWSNPQGLRRVVVRQGSAGAVPGAVGGAVPARGETVEALTWTRSVAAGETIRPEDLAWTPVQAHLLPAGAPQDVDAVVGLTARRALRSGSAVRPDDVSQPKVISRNELVTVTYQAPGVTLTVTGRAQRDAARGQPVAIVNLQSGRTIDAVATGPGRAVAGPAAQSARRAPSAFQ